jgi:nitroreductase
MTEIIRLSRQQSWPDGPPIPQSHVGFLVETAARAPSVHNTQPWSFRVNANAIELYADGTRKLPALDPSGREMLISCGGALFGLRLAIRHLGYVPAVSLLPDPGQEDLLARVYLGPRMPITPSEQRLLAAVPHRHTHRGPFSPGPVPPGLLTRLQHDAVTEGAELVLVEQPGAYQRLAALVTAADRWQRRRADIREELRGWTRPAGSGARDGVPASAYPPVTSQPRTKAAKDRLTQRDFDLGRGTGLAAVGGAPPAATAILATPADAPLDWLSAGQALQRLLVNAASRWIFASLTSEPLESRTIRAMLARGLGMLGSPQMVLQFGRAHVAEATARRPVRDVLSDQ